MQYTEYPLSHAQRLPLENPYLLQQKARESNARSYPRRLEVALARGSGIYLEDTEGKRYIDCLSGAGALALGHHHPAVTRALERTLAQGVPLQTLDLTTPVKHDFIDALFASLPESFARRARVQFCGPSGADAVEAAVKLVKTATGRRSMFSFHGGYHGMTHGALSLTGCLEPKLPIAGLMADVHFMPYPYAYRCPFGLGEDGQRLASRYIEHLLDDANSGVAPPAGMILELIQGEGGVVPAPAAWLLEMRRITRERKIPLIVDEIQTGFGRTGSMFAFQHAGIEPDVLVLSKAVGGGLPLSVVVYSEELDRWAPGAHAGTFRGNQLAMAAGLATLEVLRKEQLDRNAAAMGERLLSHLRQIQRSSSGIGEVRGRGLMLGAEIVDRHGAFDRYGVRQADPALARRMQSEALARGLIVEVAGRNDCVVKFLPALIVTREQVDTIAEIFQQAVRAAEQAA
jgi:diaminobutyrate-2-oxoglutarate transaminase